MKIKFIGYGDAFDHEHGNSSAVLYKDDYKILIDCGYTVYPELKKLHLVEELTHVLITHLHCDHVGSLATLLQHRYLFPRSERLKLLYPDEKFRKTLENFLGYSIGDPAKTAEFVPLSSLGFAEPIDTTGKHKKGFTSYGYIFKDGDNTIVYSGDLGDSEYLFNELKKRGIEKATVFQDVAFTDFAAHGFYKRVEKHLDKYDIYGYHNNPQKKPFDCKLPLVAEQEELIFKNI